MMKERIKYVNQFGCVLPKICLSCEHCKVGVAFGANENERLCDLMRVAVPIDYTCKNWKPTLLHKMVGSSEPGRIKKKQYLIDAYRFAHCHDYSIAPAGADIEQFRNLWELKNKTSIYLDQQ